MFLLGIVRITHFSCSNLIARLQSSSSEDGSSRYVAEENIELTTEEPPESLRDAAGQYFKRWDRHSGQFVSNMIDIYPDD